MLPTQLPPPHKRARHATQKRHARIQYPHIPQTPRERLLNGRDLRGNSDGLDAQDTRGGVSARESVDEVRCEADGRQGRGAGAHAVLEEDAADDDGDGSGEVEDEAEGSGSGGGVGLGDVGLDGDEGGFEEHAGAEAGDGLEEDDFGEVRGGGEVDEEAEAEGHEEGADPHEFAVAAGGVDEDADDDAGDGLGEEEGEGEDAGADGRGGAHGLEVEGHVVFTGDEDLFSPYVSLSLSL